MSEQDSFTATIEGDKLYQKRAREAFPLLVRQAEAGELISYSDLAAEMGMPDPQNLNYVLGAIGNTFAELSRTWRSDIPPNQCVAVSKATGIPGEGISGFLSNAVDFKSLSRSQRREIVKAELQRIFTYRRWRDVLGTLASPMSNLTFRPLTGLLHALVVRRATLISGSGTRGLYQCVKYLAVMQAVCVSEGRERSARVVLILGDRLPVRLIALKNLLGVEVIDGVVRT
jgi:hypothetical protein